MTGRIMMRQKRDCHELPDESASKRRAASFQSNQEHFRGKVATEIYTVLEMELELNEKESSI